MRGLTDPVTISVMLLSFGLLSVLVFSDASKTPSIRPHAADTLKPEIGFSRIGLHRRPTVEALIGKPVSLRSSGETLEAHYQWGRVQYWQRRLVYADYTFQTRPSSKEPALRLI